MELIFEMLNATRFVPTQASSKTFKQAGGLIGRGEDCDWVIPDSNRHVSNHHAVVSFRDGAFFLTDTSSNGTLASENGARLPKGEPQRIEQGSRFTLGGFEIRARLVRDPAAFDTQIGRPHATGSFIPEDLDLDLDPLGALKQQDRAPSVLDELKAFNPLHQEPSQRADYARIDRESLLVPELVPPPQAPVFAEPTKPQRQGEDFWQQFGAALEVDLKGLDDDNREALALNAARLLKQCIDGLQQSLRTRSELKNELRLSLTTPQASTRNPLKFAAAPNEVLSHLLLGEKPGQLPAKEAISQAFGDLQAHQVALLAASRAALRATLEHFSPQQLTLRFERDSKPLLATSASHWRAYRRYHHTLHQDSDWSERLLARDFAQAYEEQVRLIRTLQIEHQG